MTDELLDDGPRPAWRERIRAIGVSGQSRASAIESGYLSLLRYSLLILATLLLFVAIWLVLSGLWRQVGSSEIEARAFHVTAADVAPTTPENAAISGEPVIDNAPFALSGQLRQATLNEYKRAFAPFQRKGDKITDDQIINAVWPEERRAAFDGIDRSVFVNSQGDPLATGEQVALHAVSLVGSSAREDGFVRALKGYQEAKKVRVCRDVTKQRTRQVSYWDSYSTSCENWYYSPVGCSSTRMVTEPYTVKACELQFPGDLSPPHEAMAGGIENFLRIAEMRTADANRAAEEEAAEMNARKAAGRASLSDGGKIFLGFLALMLLYLLVVLERHHRALGNLIPPEADAS